MAARVKFNEAVEFLNELAQANSDGLVIGRIVRVTRRFTRTGIPALQVVSLEAGYLLQGEPLQLVYLHQPLGEVGFNPYEDENVHKKIDEALRLVERTAVEMGLDVRAGAFEVGELSEWVAAGR